MAIVRFLHRHLIRQTMPACTVAYYDRMITCVQDFYLEPFVKEVQRSSSPGARVLDVGTGTGQLPVMLACADGDLRVTGIDLSRQCLAKAAEHAGSAGVSDRVTFARVDLERDGWTVEPFDLAVSSCSLHHWRHPARILKAVSRLVKPGGGILLLDDAAEVPSDARRRWRARVQEAMGPSFVFRLVYGFEARWLAYSRRELERLAERAQLRLAEWRLLPSPFFVARLEGL